ncbi:MAG: ferredoxin-thioredoxin reductase variable chain [Cyanobacteria bacterium J06639_1]
MQVGDRVRVKSSVVVFHHPEHRNEPYDLKGLEGELSSILVDWNGKTVGTNYPFQVKFGGQFKAHLRDSEIELAN